MGIEGMNAKDAKKAIAGYSREELKDALEFEQGSESPRSSVIKAIEKASAKLDPDTTEAVIPPRPILKGGVAPKGKHLWFRNGSGAPAVLVQRDFEGKLSDDDEAAVVEKFASRSLKGIPGKKGGPRAWVGSLEDDPFDHDPSVEGRVFEHIPPAQD